MKLNNHYSIRARKDKATVLLSATGTSLACRLSALTGDDFVVLSCKKVINGFRDTSKRQIVGIN